jgi:hypothetical protein
MVRPAVYPHIASLNAWIDLPTDYRARATSGDPSASYYLLDYNYRDREAARGCIERLETAIRVRGIDVSARTLLLSARGLDPIPRELVAFAHRFREHHVFVELWNGDVEVAELLAGELDHVYYLPVSARFRQPSRRSPSRPNRAVFVSLGGDDDWPLLEAVIRARRDLTFYVPTRRWIKEDPRPKEVRVRLARPNVVPVRASSVYFTPSYRLAFLRADTVLIATTPTKRHQMRGGVRVADALRARKRIVLAENALCELLMAQPERTACVAAHAADALCDALEHAVSGSFVIDEPLFDEIRSLTDHEAKLAFIAHAALDPMGARRTAFFRAESALRAEADRIGCAPDRIAVGERPAPVDEPSQVRTVESLDALACGTRITAADVVFEVMEIRHLPDDRHEIELRARGERPFVAVVRADGARFCTTERGRALAYVGHTLTPLETTVLLALAQRL